MKIQLSKRAGETMYAYRSNEIYFRDTFCKMTQGLATMRAWKEAQEKQESYNADFNEIAQWASKLQPQWERSIFQEKAREVDEMMRKEKIAYIQEQKRLHEANEKRMREIAASREKQKTLLDTERAKSVEEELIREEEEAQQSSKTKKRTGKH